MEQGAVLITGASRGLGAAAARAAAGLGGAVVLAARTGSLLEQEAAGIRAAGGQALAVPADISREADCRELVRAALDHFGGLRALVNNGGVIEPIAPVAEASLQEWEHNLQVNLLGAVRLIQLALPHLRQSGGRIINVSSGASINVVGGWGAYSAAKAALNHLSRVLASEEPQVTCLALRPGLVDTEMQATIRQKGQGRMAERNYEFLSAQYAQGRLLPPEQPGRAIACLALHAPPEWSGEFLQWDDPRVQALVAGCFPDAAGS